MEAAVLRFILAFWLICGCRLEPRPRPPSSLQAEAERPAPSSAEEGQAAAPELPAPLSEYMGRSIATTMHWSGASWLVRESREAEESAARMRQALDLREGMVVCDFGAGNGYHTLALAEAVGPRGKVFAVEVQPEMLNLLAARATAQHLENIELVLGTYSDPKLPPVSCDLILLVDVYHELGYPEEVLAGLARALRPGAELVLVEFRAEDPTVPIKTEHKMSRAQVERELAANQFRLKRSFDELPWQHLLVFEYVATR